LESKTIARRKFLCSNSSVLWVSLINRKRPFFENWCYKVECSTITLRKNVVFWDLLLYLVIGLAISTAVLSVGPLIVFGFLLIPALKAHLFARNMRQCAMMPSLVGGMVAFFGSRIAYRCDLPADPTDVVLLAVPYAAAWLTAKCLPVNSIKELKR